MYMVNYKSLNQLDREKYIIPLILKALQNLGGESSRNDIKKEMSELDPDLAPAIEEVKTSTKNSGTFHPFDFRFNFAIKTLMFAGYLTYERAHPIQLTDKGVSADPDSIDFDKDIYAISDPKWKEVSERNAERKHNKEVLSDQNNAKNEADPEGDSEEDVHDEFKDKLLSAIARMSPKKFEVLCRMLLKKMGITVDQQKGVSYVGDGGIDGYGYHLTNDYRTSRVAIQAKRWQGKVSSPEIDKFRGAMDKFHADYGIFITNSYYTKDAVDAARAGTHMITLVDGDKLTELVEKYQVYVKPVTTYILDDFYSDDNE